MVLIYFFILRKLWRCQKQNVRATYLLLCLLCAGFAQFQMKQMCQSWFTKLAMDGAQKHHWNALPLPSMSLQQAITKAELHRQLKRGPQVSTKCPGGKATNENCAIKAISLTMSRSYLNRLDLPHLFMRQNQRLGLVLSNCLHFVLVNGFKICPSYIK